MTTYAHICPKCNHEVWRHGLLPGQDVTGLYRCGCGCEIRQNDPAIRLNKSGYEAWLRRKAETE